MKNMKKIKLRWASAICVIMALTILTGCSGGKLSEKFDEEEVKLAAENVINLVNSRDTESIRSISMPELKVALTDESLGKINEELDKSGEFEEIEKIRISGQKDKNSEDEYAVTVVRTKYEEKNFIYTITFNEKMELAGLYIK